MRPHVPVAREENIRADWLAHARLYVAPYSRKHDTHYCTRAPCDLNVEFGLDSAARFDLAQLPTQLSLALGRVYKVHVKYQA